uniref:Serine aminopeptidase S33 domain-containing protein n=1 Tax=Candidatus Kentrum sp. TUN TaxID=2126343 RepID=A0A450ZNT1_9GAMM|nr:MAG: hypothetical protein BECKTUN1418F_GA0071002_10684 [Candidatus Kentron sp. TUN]VFK59258.1 MAG: hypothetical protein BECKTUN1418D_GA0071000_10987 [Candidatus Kentron sp. TUN]VFK61437.1 MAG: hypothetical protein BECKTUN1418E_GA0071001_10664 [Candidatus Kentron sp. TUN]
MIQPDLLRRIDHPRINSTIFFPRQDPGLPPPPDSEDFHIEVEPGVHVMARYHPHKPDSPMLLHFHGNGEIVADYDNIAPAFRAAGASLISVDYRGYGKSDGQPSVHKSLDDAHVVLDFILKLREERGYTSLLAVMGRSLGSAPAIDIAASRGDELAGLVVESGFAQTPPLLALFGISIDELDISPGSERDNEDKMVEVQKPVLILHAEEDEIIPLWNAERNFAQTGTQQKRLVTIPRADHNTIMMFGDLYWGGLKTFLSEL